MAEAARPGSGANRGDAAPPQRGKPARNLRRLRVKYRGRGKKSARGLRAMLVTVPQSKGDEIFKFTFPFTPISMSYEDLAPEYVEIERPGDQPFVELKSFKLMKVSFTFLLAVPFDGIEQSVDADIFLLRRIANSRNPVAILNMDKMVTNAFNIQRLGNRRGVNRFFFRVADLSVEAIRRNENNKVTVAEVSITLQEVANPRVKVIRFPEIVYPDSPAPASKPPKKKNPSGNDGGDQGAGDDASYPDPYVPPDEAEVGP